MSSVAKYKSFQPLWVMLHRYHVIIFTILVLGSLAGATFFLYQTIIKSTEVTNAPNSSGFDEATIKKIEKLQSVDDSSGQASNPPRGNRNPFVE